MLSIVFSVLSAILHVTWASDCPRNEYLSPNCFCQEFSSYAMMSCSNIMNPEELIPPIKASEQFDMFGLTIADSTLMYIPSDLFKDTTYAKIRFENTQVLSLSDSDLAFVGLENKLEEIRADGEPYIARWDWSQLKNLKALNLIDIHKIGMHSLDNEFPLLESLVHLGISVAQISFIHPEAFVNLPELNLLVLKQNDITEIKRSMFPSPALKMYHLDLSDNLLSSLPTDLFSKMPNLKEVLLNNNKFKTLNEDTFSPIFNRLQMFMMKGNQIRCDCRMKWLVQHRIPLYFEGVCHEPETMKGASLKYIKHNELWCYLAEKPSN